MFLKPKSSIFHNIAEYVIYIFIATLPFLNYTSFLYFGSSTRSINLILVSSILGLILGLFLLKKESEVSVPRSPILLVLFVYFLGVFVSALNGLDFKTSFYSNITRTTGLWYMTCLGLFLLFLVNLFKNEIQRRKLIISIIISSAIFSFLSLLSPEGFNVLFTSFKGDGFSFGNSTFAGMYILGSFILSLYFVFSEKVKSFWKICLPFLIFFNPYIVNISSRESKGILSVFGEARASAVAVVGAILVLVFIFIFSKIKNLKLKKNLSYGLFFISLVSLIFAAGSLFSKDGALRQFYLSQATSARLLVWDVSDKLIAERPLLGWGTENFEKTFELNYDSRSLEEKYGNEAWFDRAHNIFIDQTFDNGFIGLVLYILVFIILGLSLLYVIFNSKNENNRKLAVLLLVYFGAHLVELQTSFDTSISYIIFVVMIALAISIYRDTLEEKGLKFEYDIGKKVSYVVAVLLIGFCSWSLFFKAVPFVHSQIVNGTIRTIGSAEKRIPLYPALFNTPVDLQAILWRTLTDFERGVGENPKVLEDSKKVELLKQELVVFEEEYKKYTESNPKNFRALLNYANVKIYFMLFGVNKLEEAQSILDQATKLVPQAPHPLWMKAVAYLYMQKLELAKKTAKQALDLNPEVETSKEVMKYIEDSITTFPEIELYFFRQI